MATEALTWPGAPTLTNGNDSTDYTLGIRFSVSEAVSCVGVRWTRTPDSVSPAPTGGTHVAALWTVADEARVAFQNFTPTAATDDFDILFAAPVLLDPSPVLYVASIFSRDYVFRASGGIGVDSPSGIIAGDEGRIVASASPLTYPGTYQPAYYYISPLIELPGSGPSQGSAAFTLDLALATSGTRTSSGSAAVGLDIALAAIGSDGGPMRPVTPWPHGGSAVTDYPWAARPVKSFQDEVL